MQGAYASPLQIYTLCNATSSNYYINPFLPGPIGSHKSDPVFLKIRDDFISFFHTALICYSVLIP